MGYSGSSAFAGVKVGSSDVSKIYVGSTLAWEPAPAGSSDTVLLHMDGANGGTTFTDSGANGYTVSVVGANVQTSTTQVKFGTASAYFSASAGNYLSIANAAALDIGTQDFTMDCWIYFTAAMVSGSVNIAGMGDTAASDLAWRVTWDSYFASFLFNYSTNGTSATTMYFTGTPTGDAWNHVAVVRASNVMNLYLNGTKTTTVDQANSADFFAGPDLWIGSKGTANAGYLDEFRYDVGTAHYTANFTPPTAPY